METERILLRPWHESDAEVLCPNLEVGSDRPVRVMKLVSSHLS